MASGKDWPRPLKKRCSLAGRPEIKAAQKTEEALERTTAFLISVLPHCAAPDANSGPVG
jgi:hypothetical protein